MLSRSFVKLSVLIFFFSFSELLKAQNGGTNCSAAQNSSITIPYSENNHNLCGNSNDYNGNNGCGVSWGNDFGGQDWMYSFTATQTGFLNVTLSDIIYPNNSWGVASIGLFQGCPGSAGACLGLGQSSWGGNASLFITVNAGITYTIVIDAISYLNYYSNCFRYDINISLTTIPIQPSCTNMGFTSNNLNGWFATTGSAITGPTGAQTPTYAPNSFGVVNGRHTIMTGGNDPIGNFPRVDPTGGPYSLRLGNNSSGAEAEQVRQTFLVSTSNSSFTYRYAVVFEDPGHSSPEQPFFRALLRDQNGTLIPCSDFIVSAQGNLPGFSSALGGTVRYKPWSTVNVDLSNYLGQNVTAEFTTGDCSQGGHFGYAYIDAFCSPSTLGDLADTICPGQSVTLTAPNGYQQYTWNPGNIQSQTVTYTPAATTTYTLSLTAFNGCVSNFTVPITLAPLPTPSFTAVAPACDLPVTFNNTTPSAAYSITNLNWSFGGTANPPTSNLLSPDITFPGPGIYPVSLNVVNSAGCSGTIIQNVTVPPCVFRVTITGDTICAGECYTFNYTTNYGFPPYTVQWSTSANTGATETLCVNATTLVTITLTDATGDVATDTAMISVPPSLISQELITNVICNGENNGSINPQIQGWGPFDYSWSNGSQSSQISTLFAGTYSVLITDAGNCQYQDTFVVTEPAPILFGTAITPSTCGLANGQINISNISGGFSPYEVGIDTLQYQSGTDISGLGAGLYTVYVKDSNQCRNQTNVNVNALSFPSQISIQLNDAFCDIANGSIELSNIVGGVSPFQVSLNGAFSGNFDGSNYLINQLDSGLFDIHIVDANNCVLDTNATLMQHPSPTGILYTTTPATCGLNNASLMLNAVINGTAPYLFSLNSGAFSSDSAFSDLAPTNFLVTVQDSNGCIYDTNIVMPFIEDLEATISLLQHVKCFGGIDGGAFVSILSGSSPFQYVWNNGVSNDSVTNLSLGTATVVITDSVGCIENLSIQINEPSALSFQIEKTNATCGLDNGVIEVVNVQGGTPGFDFSINGNSFQEFNTFQNLPDTSVTISVKDANGCIQSDSIAITMISFPSAISISKVDAICGLPNGSISLEGVFGGVAPFTVNCTNQIETQTSLFPLNWIGLPQQNYLISVSDSNNCQIELDTTILQFDGPSFAFLTVQPAICGLDNASVEIDSLLDGTAPFQYSFGISAFGSALSSGDIPSGPILIQVRDANNCLLDTLINAPFIENINISLAQIDPITCFGYSNGAAGVNVLSGSYPFTFNWSNGSVTQINDSIPAGAYSVTVADSLGCEDQGSITLIQPLKISVTATGPDYVCEGKSVTVQAFATGGQGHLDVLWPAYSHSAPILIDTPDSSTNYEAIAVDLNGCVGRDSHFVSLKLSPQGTIEADISEGCAPVCANFSLSITNNAIIESYLWSFSNAEEGNNSPQKTCFFEEGIQSATVLITDNFGCKNELSAQGVVNVFGIPKAAFSSTPDKPDLLNPEVQFIQESISAHLFDWRFGDGGSSDEMSPKHAYQDTGTYEVCLKVTSEHGCEDETCEPVSIYPVPTIWAPSAFTPNGDGTNERFKVVVLYATKFQLEIFNRWGEMIYSSIDQDEGWDGTYKSNPAQIDTYVWKVSVTNSLKEQKQITGRVTLYE